jgi:hypothetical protein
MRGYGMPELEKTEKPARVHERLDADVVADLHAYRVKWDHRMTISDVIRRLIEERSTTSMMQRICDARQQALLENREPYIIRLTEEDCRTLADELEPLLPLVASSLRPEDDGVSPRSTFGEPVILGMPVNRADESYIVAKGKRFLI